MNKIYRVVWNDVLRLFQVTSELTRSHRKSNSGSDGAVVAIGGAEVI